MINSFSGGDAVTVRGFNNSMDGIGITTQEDQCDKKVTIHTIGNKIITTNVI